MKDNEEYLHDIYVKWRDYSTIDNSKFYKTNYIKKVNYIIKRIAIVLIGLAVTSGVVYAGYTICKNDNIQLTPTFANRFIIQIN